VDQPGGHAETVGHIGDAGGTGILQTIANLRTRGIAASGAGKNLAAARKPTILEAGGTKVAFLAYDTIAKTYAAGPNRAGSAQMSAKVVRQARPEDERWTVKAAEHYVELGAWYRDNIDAQR